MRPSRFSKEKIEAILEGIEQGFDLKTLCKEHRISTGTFYKWRTKYYEWHQRSEELTSSISFKKIHRLQQENRQLLTLYTRVCREKIILQEAMEGKL